jgi:Leucine-rich repeat (LRR) protein
VEETSFSGDIPRLPPNLVNFDISFSFFTGGLNDANFQGINTLNFIDVDGNAFNTTVPKAFATLPNLQFLYLSDAFISGDLSFMQGMTSLREMWLDTNPGISGPIFDYIGSITTLESLSLTFNSLTGTIPTTLGQLTGMTQMWLYSNQLTGPVPSQLGNLKAMTILQVEGNMFAGTMPTEICANTMFPTQVLTVLGADCADPGFNCTCCTCCSLEECSAASA